MKRLVLVTAILAMAGLSYPQNSKPTTFTGEIMDSFCAEMGNHGGKPAAECTETCVKMGAKYVLYSAADKTSYELDDQKKPASFAGKKVAVTGTLDKASKTIHVTGIKAA